MPKLPFKGFPGSAHYQVHRDTLRLRYRFPWMERFETKASPYTLPSWVEKRQAAMAQTGSLPCACGCSWRSWTPSSSRTARAWCIASSAPR
jgi:hypothetical protein